MVRGLCILVLFLAPATAAASDDVRVSGSCGTGASSSLRLRADDGTIRLEFRVRHRPRALWRFTIVQEGVVVWRGSARASRSSRTARVRRELRDFSGADRVTVRGIGPSGLTCTATATVAESARD
jgi:hypothetical protein